MSLLKEIKEDLLVARKRGAKTHTALLSTLVGEAEKVSIYENRETTDAEVIKTIRKFVKGCDEIISITASNPTARNAILEKEILNLYLPKTLSDDELEDAIDQIIWDGQYISRKMMGKVMKELAEKYPGQYDGKLASEIVRKRLNA